MCQNWVTGFICVHQLKENHHDSLSQFQRKIKRWLWRGKSQTKTIPHCCGLLACCCCKAFPLTFTKLKWCKTRGNQIKGIRPIAKKKKKKLEPFDLKTKKWTLYVNEIWLTVILWVYAVEKDNAIGELNDIITILRTKQEFTVTLAIRKGTILDLTCSKVTHDRCFYST